MVSKNRQTDNLKKKKKVGPKGCSIRSATRLGTGGHCGTSEAYESRKQFEFKNVIIRCVQYHSTLSEADWSKLERA